MDDDAVSGEGGRAGEAPGEVSVVVGGHVENAEILLPEKLAGEVVGVEAFGAEEGDEVFAVGREGGVGVGGFGVAGGAGEASVGGAFPDDAAGFTVEAVELPGLLGVVVGGVAGSIEADFEGGFAFGADGGGDVKMVAPEDGAGVAEAGDGGAPEDGF